MFGKGALIMVIGFAIIAGYMNLNITQLTSRAVESMVGYNELNASRTAANAGANIGLAMLTANRSRRGLLTSQTPQKGGLKGSSFTVTVDSVISTTTATAGGGASVSYTTSTMLRLRSVAVCTTEARFATGDTVVLQDTVEVRLAYATTTTTSFSTLGWMTVQEGNVFFITGDTLWGQVHSNSNIHIDGKPIFHGKVTTSGHFDPKISSRWKKTDNEGVFLDGYEEGVAEREFPDDLSLLKLTRTNSDTTPPLYVQLMPGTSADDDGYAIVRNGSWTGAILDSMRLDGTTNNVIYSNNYIHVRGTIDGRLSICSNRDLYIDNDIKYEREPNPLNPSDPKNSTTDMLGLIAEDDVIVANNSANNGNNLSLDASIFCRTGSFTAEDYNTRGVEGTIFSIGSIAQKTRGAIGTFSGSTLHNGYHKSYKYDPRLADPRNFPPSFPGFSTSSLANRITDWWESGWQPLIFW